jgi:O-antigen ligase
VYRLFVAGQHAYPVTLLSAAITCALMPWYTVRWHYGPLPTTLLETGILVTLAVFALESWRRRMMPAWRSPFTLPALLFIVAGAISVLVAPSHSAALGLYRAYILEPIAFFLALSHAVRSWAQARPILLGLAISGIALALPNEYVVLQAIRHHSLNLAGAPPVAIYQTPNAVALFLVPLIALAAAIAIYSPDRRDRWAAVAYLLLTLPAALLTFSRGGYVALLVIGLLLALSHRSRVWLVPSLALIAAAFSRIPAVATRIGHQLNPADPNNSLDQRMRLWKATLRMLQDHPIFGTGLSGFARNINGYRDVSGYSDTLIYPHNILLNFWTETGLLGLAAFAWIFVSAGRVAWRGWRAGSRSWRPLQLGVMLALTGMLVHGLVDVPYLKNDLSLEFWVLLGLSWAGRLEAGAG